MLHLCLKKLSPSINQDHIHITKCLMPSSLNYIANDTPIQVFLFYFGFGVLGVLGVLFFSIFCSSLLLFLVWFAMIFELEEKVNDQENS